MDELREKRNSLCDMLGVKRPVRVKVGYKLFSPVSPDLFVSEKRWVQDCLVLAIQIKELVFILVLLRIHKHFCRELVEN